jgi:WD40-like Beta Propeller Repeat
MDSLEPRRTVAVILAVGLLVAALIAGVVWLSSSGGADDAAAVESAQVAVAKDGFETAMPAGRLLVRAVDPAAPRADERLFEVSPDGQADEVSDLSCKRVHANASGAGVCLAVSDDGIDYEGIVFDGDYRPGVRFKVKGIPDRARISPDGRYVGYTSFDAASSQGYFENASEFTTYTRIVDLRTGKESLKLEDLRFTRHGKPYVAVDPKLWGVTFARNGRFYATLALGSEHFLIEGRVGERKARIVTDHVECPALSPDGTRIAYKRRIDGGDNKWRYHVLDLRTRRDTALAERRSIDDQPEWLNDDYIVYSDDKTVSAVRADGGGHPAQLASGATSPAAMAPQSFQ